MSQLTRLALFVAVLVIVSATAHETPMQDFTIHRTPTLLCRLAGLNCLFKHEGIFIFCCYMTYDRYLNPS